MWNSIERMMYDELTVYIMCMIVCEVSMSKEEKKTVMMIDHKICTNTKAFVGRKEMGHK